MKIAFDSELSEQRGGVILNELRIDFYQIFRIIFHLLNQSNHKSNRIVRILNEFSI